MLASLRDMVSSQKPAAEPAAELAPKSDTAPLGGKGVEQGLYSPKGEASSPSIVEQAIATQGHSVDDDTDFLQHGKASPASSVVTAIRGSNEGMSPPVSDISTDGWLEVDKSPGTDRSGPPDTPKLQSYLSAAAKNGLPGVSETSPSSSFCHWPSAEASPQARPPRTPSTGEDTDTGEGSFFCFPPKESEHPELAAYLRETSALFLSSLEEVADPLDSRLPGRDTPADRAEWQASLMAAMGKDALPTPMWAEMLGAEEALGDWAARVDAELQQTGAPVPLAAWRRLRAELLRAEMRSLEREVRGLGERRRELAARDAETARLLGKLRELGEEESDSRRRRRAREEVEDQVAEVQEQAAERVAELRERLLAAETRCDRLARSEQDKTEEAARLGEQLAKTQQRLEEAQRGHSRGLLELVQRMKKEAAEKDRAGDHELLELQQRVRELERQLKVRNEELFQAKSLADENSSLCQASNASWESKVDFLTAKVRALNNRLNTTPTKSSRRGDPDDEERIAELERMLADCEQDTRAAEAVSEAQLREVTQKLAAAEQQVRRPRPPSRAPAPAPDGRAVLLRTYPSLVPLMFPTPDDSDPLLPVHNFGSDSQHLSRKQYLRAFFDIKARQNALMERCCSDAWAAAHPAWDPLAEAEGLIAELRELDAGEDADHVATSVATLHLVRAVVLSRREPVGREFQEALTDVAANNRGDASLTSQALRLETHVLRKSPALRR